MTFRKRRLVGARLPSPGRPPEAVYNATVVHSDCWVNEITTEFPEPGQRPIFFKPASLLYPTTSAARIAASFLVSPTVASFAIPHNTDEAARPPC
jgi:hypothetical protein